MGTQNLIPLDLWEYGVPDTTTGALSSIVRLAINAANFELKPQFIQFISNDSFVGLPNECPVSHIASFLEKCDTVKINNVSEDAIRLRLFPLSLRDRAKEWLRDEGVGMFDTWGKLAKAFLVKFFGQEKTAKLRNELATFEQHDDESLYEAWRRFLRLQRQCPHHGIPEWMLIQTFYNGLTHEFRIYIDAASGGSLMTKNPAEAKELIEKMAANDNTIQMVAIVLRREALSHKFDRLQAGSSMMVSCQMCGVQGHAATECQINNDGMTIEQANALYNSNPKQPYDPYSNTYNEGWKHNPAFSYKNTQAQLNPSPPPRNNFNAPPGFQARAPFNPHVNQGVNQQPPSIQQKSNLEIMMENLLAQQTNFMAQQGKQNEKTDNAIQQIQAQNKLLESQISQLAHQVGQLSKTPGHFPGNSEQPSKGHINVVILRNGKELQDHPLKEPSKRTMEEMIEENATVSLTAECSAILHNKLPKKLGDPGSYSIPVKLGDIEIKKALCDLGASVSLMPLSFCKKLQMGEPKPTRISLHLADRTVKYPLGILEDVPLRVGKFFIPCDFVVMEMEEDAQVPIILGRPFLATAGAIIDMKNGKITFEVGTEKMEYNLTNPMEAPSMGETIYRVDALDETIEVKAASLQLDDSSQTVLMGSVDEEDWETLESKRLLEELHSLPSIEPIKEVLTHEESKESTMLPKVELKANENSRLYKERRKRWPDKHIMRREFHVGELVLLFNSRLKLFPGFSVWLG
ncbi:uncharacterized protein LOC125493537 [Beta vulgaris subsp. vulgaris]|uniref:uncharacterized protein LOC125493537 n=1 Tax=Beta vulgaris subsp. vulgaris TaxID=3555 RepID=UPI002546F6FF|nr:uncharacterized protein LOC125493537 [Beta vulgaris subsp. vulgaris]